MRRILCVSDTRYRASAREKAQYGGSTVTVFFVHFEGDPPERYTGYGPTPGERATFAKREFLKAKGLLP